MTRKEKQTVPVATRITKPMFKGIQIILASDAHINTADYIRDLIRRDLDERGVLIDKEQKMK